MMFKQPYYVSPHAVQRFRQRVADLPTKAIRTIIQSALQDQKQVKQYQKYNKCICPVYTAEYRDVEYLIPVIPENRKKNGWPVVPTVLLPGMKIYNRRFVK